MNGTSTQYSLKTDSRAHNDQFNTEHLIVCCMWNEEFKKSGVYVGLI
jgi:hypothetical protein